MNTVATKLPKALETVGGANAPKLAYLELPEENLSDGFILSESRLSNRVKLFRIDCNHRLSAAGDAKPGEAELQPANALLHRAAR
ncbi:hypothetical protein RP726_06910 [Candidatus Methylospira mobilis]|uniref:hypothetical protein n=1 Tax=Candidatus Methylospira mobilis TaxID=1808979 RepID=UPI0028E6BC68|nr:hypothetical protein [Candidatus Methylospira mobilis]WNV06136.1 hypothetical protein RP726_06910 [Candidatus Methylospira mobilis]